MKPLETIPHRGANVEKHYTPSKPAELLTAREVARQLGVSVAWVLQHAAGVRKPVIPSIKMGKAVRFQQADIDAFVEHCRRCMAKGIPIH